MKRPRASRPSVRERVLAMVLFVGAGLALLPLVHAMLTRDDLGPLIILPTGMLSMGLAWAGGCAIQNRRRGSVLALGILGVLVALAPLIPQVRGWIAPAWPGWTVVAGVLSLAALLAFARAGRAGQDEPAAKT